MLLLSFQTIPTGNGCTSRVSAQVRHANGKTIKWTGGSRRISLDLGGSRQSPHLNALQFPGLQMEMEVDPPGSNIRSLVLSD